MIRLCIACCVVGIRIISAGFECDFKLETPHHRDRGGSISDKLVMHYTAGGKSSALNILSGKSGIEVSAHYMTDEHGKTYQFVDTSRAAYHAGVSYWDGVKNINNSSIGIENVNLGYWRSELVDQKDVSESMFISSCNRKWHPYPQAQIDSLIKLSKSIVTEFNIKPRNVIGHSDCSPGRKQDPGPLFPWKLLADAGVGAWPNMEVPLVHVKKPSDLSVSWVQAHLHKYGYGVPLNGKVDDQTRWAIEAFQMHFDPGTENHGKIDRNMVDKLACLVDQYVT